MALKTLQNSTVTQFNRKVQQSLTRDTELHAALSPTPSGKANRASCGTRASPSRPATPVFLLSFGPKWLGLLSAFLLTTLTRPLPAQEFTLPVPPGAVEVGKQLTSPAPLPPPLAGGTDRPAIDPANGPEQLDLQTLLDMAVQCNPTLRQARAQIGATMGAAIQAGLYPNPELAYAAEQIGLKGTAGEFHGAIFRQTIVTAGKRRLSRAKYLQRVKAAEALALTQQYRVCNDIAYESLSTINYQRPRPFTGMASNCLCSTTARQL